MRQQYAPRIIVAQARERGSRAPSARPLPKRLAWLLAVALVVSGALSACGAAGPTPTPTAPPTPTPGFPGAVYWPTTEWRTSTPEEQGIDSAQLLRALEHVDEASINLRSLTGDPQRLRCA